MAHEPVRTADGQGIMKCEVIFLTDDLHGFFQLGPFDAEEGMRDGAVLREIAHSAKRSVELVPVGDLQGPGVERGVAADGQIRLPAKFRHTRDLDEVQRRSRLLMGAQNSFL